MISQADAEAAPLPERVFPAGPGDGIPVGGAPGGGGSGATGGAGGSNEIPPDPPKPIGSSLWCGDGVRDTENEECDDGPGTEPDSCTQDCQVNDWLVDGWQPSGAGDFPRDRWLGAGRHPIAAGGHGFAVASVVPARVSDFEQPPPLVHVARFNPQGKPLDSVAISAGLFAADSADPVLAALPGGAYAVAYTELGGDGDELGIALHRLDANASSASSVSFANEGTHGSQNSADVLWTGSELIVAWEDTNAAPHGPDVKYRVFDASLTPQTGDLALADSPLPENSVALAGTAQGFAAAWRQTNEDGLETIQVFSAGGLSTVGPHLPGPAGEKPALVEVEPNLLLVVFVVGTDPDASSVANVGRLYGALIETDADAGQIVDAEPIYDFDINPYLGQSEPNLVSANGRLFLAWRSTSYDPVVAPGPEGEELWLKRLYWDPELAALDTAEPEARLPRWPEHEYGDQRAPALAVSPLAPEGALVMAWTDWGASFGELEGHPDVAVQFAPTPLLRGDRKGVTCLPSAPCSAGQGPCTSDEQCASGTRCGLDRGPHYNYGVGTGVCTPTHCFDGVTNNGETDIDCGGDCGHCFDCPDSSDAEFAHFCNGVCRCDNLEGDCDSDYECVPGLVCDEDRGKHYGFAHDDLDACAVPHCTNRVKDADEKHIDCGGNDCAPCRVGEDDFCQDLDGQRCDVGEGDCDSDAECLSSLVCQGLGPDYDLPEGVDVCIPVACLPENLPPIHTQGHCTADCRCGAGVGICNEDSHCQTGHVCRDDWAIHYDPQLPFDLPLCVPTHCGNGIQDMGETQIDCGGDCGDQCPSCDDTLAFASFEDPTRPWTVIEGSFALTQSSTTHGANAYRVSACGNNELRSPEFLTDEWNIVGDQILFDIFIPSNPANPWWVGQVAVKVTVPNQAVYEQYFSGPQLQGLTWGAWNTVAINVGQNVKQAFLNSQTGTIKVIVNIGCAGQGSTQFLIDNVRFGGNTSFRPGCGPGEGSDGTGGSTTTTTVTTTTTTGTGGTSGSDGAGGSGGVGGVGGSGGGGEAVGLTAEIFSFESPSYWAPAFAQETTRVSHMDAALRTTISTWTELNSDPFDTEEVFGGQYLHLDVYVPQPGGSWGGSVRPIFVCSSAGHPWTEFGTDKPFLSHPFNQFYTLEWSVPASVQQVLDAAYTSCIIKLALNGWNGANQVILDHLRFTDTPLPPAAQTSCTQYPQLPGPPFVGGGTIPNGSAGSPYRLCNADQLQTVIDTPGLWDDHYVLANNLDLSEIEGQIGTFSGSLNGQGYHLIDYGRGTAPASGGLISVLTGSIANLTADNFRVHVTEQAVAGSLIDDNQGSVTNVRLTTGLSSSGANRATLGGLVGLNQGAITGCHVTLNVRSGGSCRVGGVAGYLGQGASIVDSSVTGSLEQVNDSDCSAQGGHAFGGLVGLSEGHIGDSNSQVTLLSPADAVGGLVGVLLAPGDVQDSQALGPLTSGRDMTGGLVGMATGSLFNSHAECDVEGADATGGIVGFANGSGILDSGATGNVAGQARTGGLVGRSSGSTIARVYATGDVTKAAGLYVGGLVGTLESGSTLTDCYAWGDVAGTGQDSAGLIGYAVGGGSIARCYATGNAERAGLVSVDDGATVYADCYWHNERHTRGVGSMAVDPAGTLGRSEAELVQELGYAGYDFVDIWQIQPGLGYATLR